MAKKTPSAALSDVRNVVVGSKATAQSTFQPGAPASDAVPAKATLSKNLKKKIVSDSEELPDAQVPAEAQADVVLAQLTPAPAAAGAAAPAAVTAAEVTTVVAPTQVGAVAAVAAGFSPVTLAVAGAGLAMAGGGGGGSGYSPTATYAATRNAANVDEGGTVRVTVATQNVASGTVLTYVIRGLEDSDLESGTTTGSVTVGADGRATLDLVLTSDEYTEGEESFTVTFYRSGVEVAVTTASTVNDTSSGALLLTTGTDTTGTLEETTGNDVIVGTSATYNEEDVIDGDDGNDVLRLNLTARSAVFESATVSNIETLVLVARENGSEEVKLRMSGFDDQLANIQINRATADVELLDMQSIPAVSILDTDKSITLGYDEQAVAGDDLLTVTVSEFTGELYIEGDGPGVENLIESLVINVADLSGATSDFFLSAPYCSLLTIIGGCGEEFSLYAMIAPGAEINATAFDGTVNIETTFSLDVLRTGAGDDTVTTIMAGEDSVFNLGEGDNELTVYYDVQGSIVTGSGNDVVDVTSLADTGSVNLGAGNNEFTSEGAVNGSVTVGSGDDVVIAGGVGADAVITLGAGNNYLGTSGMAGTVTALGGDDEVVSTGMSGIIGTVNLGEGANTVSTSNIFGDIITGSGDDVVSAAGVAADATLSLGAGNNDIEIGDAMWGDITVGSGNDEITIEGGVGADALITMGAGTNTLSVSGGTIAGDVTSLGGVDTVTTAGIAATGSLDLGAGNNVVTSSAAVDGDITVAEGNDTITVSAGGVADGSEILMGDGTNSLTVTGASIAGDVTGGTGVDTVTTAGLATAGSLSLGGGNNVITSSSNVSGDITVGDGSDTVSITGNVSYNSSIALGGNDNSLTVSGVLDGDVTAGAGDDTVTVGSVDSSSVIDLGNGDNSLTTSGDFEGNVTFGTGDDELTVGDDIEEGLSLSSIVMGGGTNTVDVTGSVSGNVDISFGNGDGNVMTVGEDIVNAPDTITFGSGDNNTLEVGDDVIGSTLIMGGGDDNSIDIGGYVDDSTITMGNGDDISLTLGSGAFGSTVTQGDGDRASIDIGGYISGATITQGDGDDISLTIGQGAYASTITQGDGDGSIVFGQMADTSTTLESHNGINGGTATVVNLGAGNDSVTIHGTDSGSTTQIASGATLDGGAGLDDTLTINGMDDIEVIARTNAQQAMVTLEDTLERGDIVSVTVGDDTYTEEVEYTEVQVVELDFAGTYAEGDIITVSVGTDTYSYTLPIGQGGPDSATTVAQGLLEAMNEDGILADYGFTVSRSGAVLTLTGDGADLNADNFEVSCAEADITDNAEDRGITSMTTVGDNLESQIDGDAAGFTADYSDGELVITADAPAADVAITAEIDRVDESTDELDVEVLQIADAGITGFETLNLVSQAIGEDGSDGDGADFTANFDLIDGVTDINLTSELGLVEADHEGVDGYDDGDDVTFNLQNLHGGESITVSANEVTTNGNPEGQVITVGNSDGNHQIGDKITVYFGETELVYEVSADDLSSATAQSDAENIASSLEDFIRDAAEEAGYTLTRSDNELILIAGEPGEELDFSVEHTREDTYVESVSSDWNDGLMFDETDYQVGDVISIDMSDDVVVSYIVTEADLAVDCDRSAAEMVAEGVAAAFVEAGYLDATANRGWVSGVDFSGIDDAALTRTFDGYVGETTSTTVQSADDVDDTNIDVTVNAYLSAEEDSESDTLTLTVDGTGNFDLLLRGEDGDLVEQNSYEAMDLHVADSFSHYIDTNTNAGDVITMTGGAEGADIILDRVDAHTVNAGTTEANLTINQIEFVSYSDSTYANLLSGEEALDITTGSGDDWLATSANAALDSESSINLGDGENRLSLLWDTDTLYNGQALPLLMSSQFGSDEVDQSFDTETGTIGDVIDADTPAIELDTKIEGRLQTNDDVDMFAVELVAGNTYQFSMFGDVNDSDDIGADYTLYNPYLTLLDAEGNEIALNDNDGHYLNSIILFTATESGTFYLKAESYNAESNGTYAIEVLDRTLEVDASYPLEDLANLNITGHLHQLDIMTDVVLAEDSETILAMPGEDGQVEVLTFIDISVDDRGVEYADGYDDWLDNNSSSAADLTISGTASTLEIIASDGIGYVGEDEEKVVLEAIGVENLTLTSLDYDVNVEINGDDLQTLVINADDDARLTLSGVRGGVAYNADPAAAEQDQLLALTSITVSAEDDVDVYLDQVRTGASLTVIADSEFGGSGDADIDISYADLGDVSVAFGHDDDAYVDIDNTLNSTLTLGNLYVSADRFGDGEGSTVDLSISYNSDSTVTIGDVTAIASSDADLYINDNDDATLSLGSLYLESRGIGQATLQISDNDETNITVDGTVTVVAESDAEFFITSNDTYGPASTIEMGDVFLTSCDSDALLGIENNSDYADEGDLIIRMGNVTLDAASDAVVSVGDGSSNDDVTVEIGDITATAGTWNVSDADAAVYVMNNSDSNISIGNIDLTAYGDYSSQAVVRIDSDDNTTVTTGSIVAVANGDGAEAELHMDGNSDSDITIGGDVTLTSSDYTYLHVYDNSDNTVMTIEGNVLMSGGCDSEVSIVANSDSNLTIEGDFTVYAGDDSLNDDQYNGNASFNVLDNSDSSFTIDGNLSLNGVNTGLFIEDNQSSGFYAGAVSLTSTDNVVGSDGIESYDADVILENNDDSTVSMDSLSVSAETDYALLLVSDNDYSEITITGDVLIASGTLGSDNVSGDGDARLTVAYNSDSTVSLGVEYGDDGETVLVRHEVSVSGNDSATLELNENYDSVIDMGNITVVSGNEDAEVLFYDNDGNNGSDEVVISTGSIDITAFGGDGNTGANALFEVTDNDYAEITVNGDLNATGHDTSLIIDNNSDSVITITGNVSTTATGDNNADVYIRNNDDSLIAILGEEGLTISSGSDSASLNVEDNDDSLVSLASNVSLTADYGSTSVTIDNNDNASTVYLGVGLDENGDPVTGSDGAEFNQVTLSGDGNTYFSISDNDSGTDVYVGNLSLTSTGSDVEVAIVYNNAWLGCDADSSNITVGDLVIGADVDVDLDIHAGGEDTYITVGTIDIEAGEDVYFDVSNIYSIAASVTLGETIDITAGLSGEDGANVYFNLDDVDGANDITIDASESNSSYVYAEIIDSGDVETLTVSSTDAEIYIEGDSDAFSTLDIQNVTNFAYVETWAADFTDGGDNLNAGDAVTVLIGSGNVQYNALYGFGTVSDSETHYELYTDSSSAEESTGYSDIMMQGSDASDWSGDDGWYSLGAGQDFTPYPQVQTITGFIQDSYNVDHDWVWDSFYNTMQFDQSDISYRVQVEMGRLETDNEDDGEDTVSYNTDVNYFVLQSGSWVELTLANFEDALGIDSFYYEGGYDGDFVLTGLADGTTFDAVRDITQVLTAYNNATLYDDEETLLDENNIDLAHSFAVATVDANVDLMNTNSAPDVATDGIGNAVAEIFTFTGDDIGDIVIGGFFASPYASEDGRWADKLDFSQFLGDDLDSTTLDMTFSVDDGDGYFKDVIIDFTNEEYGSIRLVGAGEYNGTELELLNRVAQSVIFA